MEILLPLLPGQQRLWEDGRAGRGLQGSSPCPRRAARPPGRALPGSEAHLQAPTLSSTIPALRGSRASVCHPVRPAGLGAPESLPSEAWPSPRLLASWGLLSPCLRRPV